MSRHSQRILRDGQTFLTTGLAAEYLQEPRWLVISLCEHGMLKYVRDERGWRLFTESDLLAVERGDISRVAGLVMQALDDRRAAYQALREQEALLRERAATHQRGLEVFFHDGKYFAGGRRDPLALPEGWGHMPIADGSESRRMVLMDWIESLGPCWFLVGEVQPGKWIRVEALAPQENLDHATLEADRHGRASERRKIIRPKGEDREPLTDSEHERLRRIEAQLAHIPPSDGGTLH